VRIREGHGPSLPVVMLTALGDAASLRRGYEAGADDFLQKPVDVPALILKVRAFLRLKGLHDEIERAREGAQARARDLALLHEIGRDWSLIAEPEEFHRMVTQRLAGLIGAPVCLIALYDPATRVIAAAVPAHGLEDELARRLRYEVGPEHRALWNFRTGRAFMTNRAKSDPRLIRDIVELADADSIVLVPMLSEGHVLGLLVALNKPGGFTEADVQLLSIFAGPAASFIRSRQIFGRARRHATRLEKLALLAGEMGASAGRPRLLDLAIGRVQGDLGYDRVAFHASRPGGLHLEAEAGNRGGEGTNADFLTWALRATRPLRGAGHHGRAELAVPVRAGDHALGVLHVSGHQDAFTDEEVNLLSTFAGQLAIALERGDSVAQTERLAAQMATLYDVGLETGVLKDLPVLFTKATAEAGRLINCDHTSVLRLDEAAGVLRLFAAWARDPRRETLTDPIFALGEGVAGRVAVERLPAIVNEPGEATGFVSRPNPVGRLLSVPVTYYDQERQQSVVFGVLNATRKPGAPAFVQDDLDYLMRFAGQLSITLANVMSFEAERQRSGQLTLLNSLIREFAGLLSRERILETAARRIAESFGFPVVALGLPDFASGLLRVAASVTPEGLTDTLLPLGKGVVGRAIRERRTVVVDDVAEDPDYVEMVATTRSEAAVPIFSGADLVAMLNVESDARRAFGRGQVIALQALGEGIAIALRNAELYQALERTNARLVELDRTKSELVNIVAHDFRSPLAGILGHGELLEWLPDAPAEERLEHARAIVASATHMASLVEKTLKTTRLETGQFPFEFGLMDVAAAVNEVVARVVDDAAHPLRVTVPEDPVPAWADRERVVEVLENLVSNAVKYSPDGGEVEIELRRDGGQAVVTVRDRGLGIDNADLGRLFRPFSRIRNRRTAAIEGSGLGLYICDRIVRAHAGHLWVESQVGAGSTFSFSLPVYGVASSVGSPLVLIAAGDEATRRDVRRVAEEQGFATHEVGDGVEAVEAALRLMPAACVVDRVLPRLRAEQVAERLRDHAATRAVPVLVLADAEAMAGQSALFSACLPKPIDPGALAAALDDAARAGL
jgi:signal transduction histidine kinase/DNA-binding response OmpR family regulator